MQEISIAPFYKQFATCNLQLLLSLGVSRVFHQLNWSHSLPWSQTLLRRLGERQIKDEPRGAMPFHVCSWREGSKRKTRTDLYVLSDRLERSGAWALGSPHMAKRSFPNPALAQTLVPHKESTNAGVPISSQFRENGSN